MCATMVYGLRRARGLSVPEGRPSVRRQALCARQLGRQGDLEQLEPCSWSDCEVGPRRQYTAVTRAQMMCSKSRALEDGGSGQHEVEGKFTGVSVSRGAAAALG